MRQVWAFDCEWAPDLEAGRRLHRLPGDLPDEEVLRVMWEDGGATPEDPQPFLKTIRCRLVSIASVVRIAADARTNAANGEVKLHLWSVPALGSPLLGEPTVDSLPDEESVLRSFLSAFEKREPMLVGYNSRSADLHILAQRAFVKGLSMPAFHKEATDKPWNAKNVDLMDLLGGRGKGYGASLDEVARLSGIPGKLDTTGDDVAGMFYGGKLRGIVEYNMFDAITTYLVWLRAEHFRGAFSDAAYDAEQRLVVKLLESEAGKMHGAYLERFIDEWRRLSPDLFG